MPNRPWRVWLPAGISLAAVIGVLFVPPIPQDVAYHAFVDDRTILGVPNFWNVLSNAGFALAGVYGLANLYRVQSPLLRPAYLIFCIAVIAVCFGSGWYHVAPATPALVWDRLPMSVAFMALLSATVSERISGPLGRTLLGPLIVVGAASVFYWRWTELQGAGDLRPYALVQFLPMVLMPFMLLAYPGGRTSAHWLWYTFGAYVVAKFAEYFDGPIYEALGISGHSIKHMVSSLAVLFAIFAFARMEGPALQRPADPLPA